LTLDRLTRMNANNEGIARAEPALGKLTGSSPAQPTLFDPPIGVYLRPFAVFSFTSRARRRFGEFKEELLKEFNLHTIVRLPNGVFAPYTSIPTNILFFDRSGPTREVWYYEQPLPEGRKNYTKTAPIQFEEFAPVVNWWNKRKENDKAWKVSAKELLANGCNLDRKNPRAKEDITHLPPEQLACDIMKKEQRIAEIMGNIQKLLAK
jgi:type I restriction-modification system DNA methylase subunit